MAWCGVVGWDGVGWGPGFRVYEGVLRCLQHCLVVCAWACRPHTVIVAAGVGASQRTR